MEFLKLNTLLHATRRFNPRNAYGAWLDVNHYSTAAAATPTPKLAQMFRRPERHSVQELYRRISAVGDPKASIIPILDQWIAGGNFVYKDQLQGMIKELRHYRQYSHALEISMWMTEKRKLELTRGDVAIRLALMLKVHGIEHVENYFSGIPDQLKGPEAYCSLLYCYSIKKSVEKAEALLQKMRDLGFANTSWVYNKILNLHHRTGNAKKLETTVQEMNKQCISYDKFTYSILISAYASVSDVEGIEKTLTKMELEPNFVLDWGVYVAAASGCRKVGLVDRASQLIKKSEKLINHKRTSTAYEFLISQYAAMGKKDEVLRIWELYKKNKTAYKSGYCNIISALLKLDDFESAEKMAEEWEFQRLKRDMRIPNLLVNAYCQKGLMEKAEALINRVVSKGIEPNAWTWSFLARGYYHQDQIPDAVENMKRAMLGSGPGWKSNTGLAKCLLYLREGGLEKAEKFLKLLRDNDLISIDVQCQMLDLVKDGTPISDVCMSLDDNSLVIKCNTPASSGPEEDLSDWESSREKLSGICTQDYI